MRHLYVITLFFLIPGLQAQTQICYLTILAEGNTATPSGKEAFHSGLYVCNLNGSALGPLGWPDIKANGLIHSRAGENFYLAAGNGVLQSNDSCKNFKLLTDWRIAEALAVYQPRDTRFVLFACTASGIWKSTDDGKTWEETDAGLQTLNSHYVLAMTDLEGEKNKLFICTSDGIWTSIDQGGSWMRFGLKGKEISAFVVDPLDSHHLLVSCKNEIYRSDDNGKTWTPVYHSRQELTCVIFDKQAPQRVYAGGIGTGILVSEDGGLSWKANTDAVSVHSILCFSQDKSGGALYAGTTEGLWVSVDKGVSFKCITACRAIITSVFLSE